MAQSRGWHKVGDGAKSGWRKVRMAQSQDGAKSGWRKVRMAQSLDGVKLRGCCHLVLDGVIFGWRKVGGCRQMA